jgi:multidrug efflux pump subunit AcrA (membrane-fusion protein)
MQSPLAESDTEAAPAPDRSSETPSDPKARWWRKKLWLGLIVATVFAALATSLWLARAKKPATSGSLATSSHTPADIPGVLRLKGTTQAARTRSIQAPLLAGDKEGTLTITSLQPAGATVKQGALLVEFDRQAQLRDFLDKQAQDNKLADDVLQEEAKEDAARAKDETEIKVAEGALGTADLEMQKVELLSRIDAEKARENLEEARATLDQLKETFNLKRRAAQASIRILQIQRDRGRETMLHAKANAALMQVRSPIDGVVVLNTIWKQGNIGEVQEGDQVRPGVPFMQVVDPSAMEVQVPVNQQDVLALHDGQKAQIHLDAYPDLVCPAQLEVVDPMGKSGDFSAKVRTFSAIWAVMCTDPRLLPGLSAAVDIGPAGASNVAENAR